MPSNPVLSAESPLPTDLLSTQLSALNTILVAESGVSPDDLLVMSQPSLVPAPPPHQEHAVRVELTMTGFADRRLNQLGYACENSLELRAGIEPALSPWQGDVIPLDQRSPLKRRGEGETRRRG